MINLVLCFVWLMLLAIGIYCLSYWHLDCLLLFLWSQLIIIEIINCTAMTLTLCLRLPLWFVFIIWYMQLMLSFNSIWNLCYVGNSIWPPQFGFICSLVWDQHQYRVRVGYHVRSDVRVCVLIKVSINIERIYNKNLQFQLILWCCWHCLQFFFQIM